MLYKNKSCLPILVTSVIFKSVLLFNIVMGDLKCGSCRCNKGRLKRPLLISNEIFDGGAIKRADINL